MSTSVAVLPFYQIAEPYILTAFGLVFSALLTWAIGILQTHANIHVSDNARAVVQQAAVNAAGRILAAQEGSVATMAVDVRSPLVAEQVPLVTAAVGDAIDRLGMTPDRVAALIAGKVGLVQASAAPAVSASPIVTAGAAA